MEGVDRSLMKGTATLQYRGEVIGSASVEVLGPVSLLRSVVVSPQWRGRNWGRELVIDRMAWARSRFDALYLFTDTAAGLFEQLGFEYLPREELPVEIHDSSEFAACSACPPMRHEFRHSGGERRT